MANAYSQAYSSVNRQTVIHTDSRTYRMQAVKTGARIERLLAERGMSQAELARRVGISQPSVNALIKAGGGSKHIHKIATVLGTTAGYLSGEIDDPDIGAVSLPSPELFAEQFNLALVQEIELGYSMGGGTVLDNYERKGLVPFQRDWLRSMAHGSFDDLFVARGEGDSMQPTILDGDIVLIDASQKDVRQQDRIWAVAYGELGMIKRVRRLPGGTYHLLSDNAAVSPIHAADGEMHVIGRVIWIGRRM